MQDFIEDIIAEINILSFHEKVEAINDFREALHEISPFKDEPVDFIKWVAIDSIHANDYNPNSVAPPEMKLLELSISNDGYTQPIVTWLSDDGREVIDGFHRNKVARESDIVADRIQGYLPVVTIREDREGRNDRIASTIRHNRARGKHSVNSMSDIVIELKKRNWSDTKVAKELGMDEDEVLRLCQVSGLTEIFGNEEFSKAWDIGIFSDDEGEVITEADCG